MSATRTELNHTQSEPNFEMVFPNSKGSKKRSYTVMGKPKHCNTARENSWILLVLVKTVHVSSATQPAWLSRNVSGRGRAQSSIWTALRSTEERIYALCVRSGAAVVIEDPLGCAEMRFIPGETNVNLTPAKDHQNIKKDASFSLAIAIR
jgi:hypothetical protein